MTVLPRTVPLQLCDPLSSHNCSGRSSDIQSQTFTTEQERQTSFKRHPNIIHLKHSPSDLAEEGFYFNGVNIVCVKCKVVLPSSSSWTKGEKLRDVHRRLKPRGLSCPYAGLDESSAMEDEDDGVDGDDDEDEVDSGNNRNASRRTDLQTDGMPMSTRIFNVQQSTNGEPSPRSAIEVSAMSYAFTAKQKLREENERLRVNCHKCGVQKLQTLFLPCRHLVTCEKCAEEMDSCLLCDSTILGTVRIFLG